MVEFFRKAEKYGAYGWPGGCGAVIQDRGTLHPPSSSGLVTRNGTGEAGFLGKFYTSCTATSYNPSCSGCNSIGIPTVPDINHGTTGRVGV